MTKNSIYPLLTLDFWTTRKCHSCQTKFTLPDYQVQNYQLIFSKVLKVDQHSLTTTFQLTHKSCCSNCTNYLKDLKFCSALISKND